MTSKSDDERESITAPSERQFAGMAEFLTSLAALSQKSNVVISTTFQLGHRHAGDFTAIQFEYDHEGSTYRAVPVTYTRTLSGGAA